MGKGSNSLIQKDSFHYILSKRFLSAFQGKITGVTMVRFFLEVCPYKQLGSKHYDNALIAFSFSSFKRHFLNNFTNDIRCSVDAKLYSSIFDRMTNIFIFQNDKLMFRI
jgi:hypothetical protein